MKNALFRAGLALLVLILAAGCGSPTPAPLPTSAPQPTATPAPEPAPATAAPEPDTRRYVPFRSEELGFGLDYPEDWQVTEKDDVPAVVFISPRRSEDDEFQENVTIVAQDLVSPSMSLDEFSRLAVDQGAEYISQFSIVESMPTTVDGNPAHRISYTGLQEQRGLYWLQVWTIKNGQVYLLTYTAEELEFNRYRSIVQQMIRTLTID